MGNVIHTRLRIVNNTNRNIINTSASDMDDFDWFMDGRNRPDINFCGVSIKARSSAERPAEINRNATSNPFRMFLYFDDGTVDEFKINQRYAVGDQNHRFEHFQKSHEISFRRAPNDTLEITVKNTYQQLQNQRAEQLEKEAELQMKQGLYDISIKKFNKALTLANEKQTIDSIKAGRASAQQKLSNQKALLLEKEGIDLMKQKSYEAAILKFDLALGLSSEIDTINSIKTHKAKGLNKLGLISFSNGLNLENERKVNQATYEFDQAKSLFQQAKTYSATSEHKNNLKLVVLKIEGNRLVNVGSDLEEEASKLFEEARKMDTLGNYKKSKNKYKDALVKYREAMVKFGQGFQLNNAWFKVSKEITNGLITAVEQTIDDIDTAMLTFNIGKVNVNKNEVGLKKTDVEINTKTQEQRVIDATV